VAALMALGSWVALPLGPVPLVLTNFVLLLAALALGPGRSSAAVGLYLTAGALGFPVFAGGRGGLVFLLGPTGGYLLGYALAAAVAGAVAAAGRGRWAADLLAAGLGLAAIYLCGLPWLKLQSQLPWSQALALGLLPFLPGDLLKAGLAVALARRLRPALSAGAAAGGPR